MKKVILFACIVSLLFSQDTTAQEAGLAKNPLLQLETYQVRPVQLEREPANLINLLNRNADTGDALADFPTDKMGIGVINTATAWTDLPRQMKEVSEEENLLMGATVGFGKGLYFGLQRGASGVIDVATFGLPPYDEPLMQPEYKTKDANQEFKIELVKW